jgi:hypothetical protein
MPKNALRCCTIKSDGHRCRAWALPGKAVCLFHDPRSVRKVAQARKNGGLVVEVRRGWMCSAGWWPRVLLMWLLLWFCLAWR